MVISREQLALLVVDLLRGGPARTAREIAAALRARPGLDKLSRSEVNSVLYSVLASQVNHDSEYRWSAVRRSAVVESSPAASVPSGGGRSGEADKPSLLRTVHRLRSGVPPSERLADLTAGADRFEGVVGGFLQRSDGQPRWMVVTGDYGEGKSHSLALLREIAFDEGFATCHLSCDGASSALNHPQRFLPGLLGTLEVPGRSIRGYEDLLHDTLMSHGRAKQLKELVDRQLTGGRVAELEAVYHVSRVVSLLERSDSGHDELDAHVEGAVLNLTGETIRHRPASPDVRKLSYDLLRIAIDLVRSIGVRGVTLLIDEVESVYTKLSNARSRRGAQRVLAALCESGELHGCSVAIASTPDAQRRFLADAPAMIVDDEDGMACEPLGAWARRLSSGALVSVQCKRLDRIERVNLLARVRSLYATTYSSGDYEPPANEWERFVGEAIRVDLPVRLLMRHALDFLDGHRYVPR